MLTKSECEMYGNNHWLSGADWTTMFAPSTQRGPIYCNAVTKAGTVAARIYDITGWTNAEKGHNKSKNRGNSESMHEMRVFRWTQSVYELVPWNMKGYTFSETAVGGCVYVLYAWMWSRCSVKGMKNGQEYCSVLRVQFSMNQKQLSWLGFHTLLSARKWDFFSHFLQVKSLQNGIKWGIFFPPTKCSSVWGRLTGNRRKLNFGDSRGVCHIFVSALNPYWTPCWIKSWLAKYWALY